MSTESGIPAPRPGLTLGGKAVLYSLLALALPVGMAELYKPGAVFFVKLNKSAHDMG